MVGGALIQASTKSFPPEDLRKGSPGKSLQRKVDLNVVVAEIALDGLSCRRDYIVGPESALNMQILSASLMSILSEARGSLSLLNT